MLDETIIAKSTAPGPAARGMIRLSGPRSFEACRTIFVPLPENISRCLVSTGSVFPWNDERPVPARLYCWPEGRGYTGRQTIEIHTFGSPSLLDALLAKICDTRLVRPAHPGEFTMQAFLADRLDLTQAEAVLGIIDARTPEALSIALDQLAGGITVSLKAVRESIFDALAHLEAGLDFADEDIEFISNQELRRVLDHAFDGTGSLQRRMDVRRTVREKPTVVLTGPPNSGKSTLFNVLLRSDRAIVSPKSGTTRDYLEADTSIDDIFLTLVDTAGFDNDDSSIGIDAVSVQHSRQRIDHADLLLECRMDNDYSLSFHDPRVIWIRTKSDLGSFEAFSGDAIHVSSLSGHGIETLRSAIGDRLRQKNRSGEVVHDTALRCHDSLCQTLDALDRARKMLESKDIVFDEALLAAEIRESLNHLGEIDGSLYAENLLDRIFGRFCIGK